MSPDCDLHVLSGSKNVFYFGVDHSCGISFPVCEERLFHDTCPRLFEKLLPRYGFLKTVSAREFEALEVQQMCLFPHPSQRNFENIHKQTRQRGTNVKQTMQQTKLEQIEQQTKWNLTKQNEFDKISLPKRKKNSNTQKQEKSTKRGEKQKKNEDSKSDTKHTGGTFGSPLERFRDISGTSPGHLRDNSGTSRGEIENFVGFHCQNGVFNFFCSNLRARPKFLNFPFDAVVLPFSAGAFAPPNKLPNIRQIGSSLSPFPHECLLGVYFVWAENTILELQAGHLNSALQQHGHVASSCNPCFGVATAKEATNGGNLPKTHIT